MSLEKFKDFASMTFKEGSVTIITLAVTTSLILAGFPSETLKTIIFYCYVVSFLLSFAVVIFRVVLGQIIIGKLRWDKMKGDCINNNYADLKSDDLKSNLMPMIEPLIKAVTEKVTNKDDKLSLLKSEIKRLEKEINKN